MAKKPTIASLVRKAGASDVEFVNIVCEVIQEDDRDRVLDFLCRLNLPLALPDSEEEKANIAEVGMYIGDFEYELFIAEGFQKYFERHLRKLKWHVSHPEQDSIAPGMRIYGCVAFIAEVRVRRVLSLLGNYEVLTPAQWGAARELLNRSYRHFRVATALVTEKWVESLLEACEAGEVREALSELPAQINVYADRLAALREEVEAARSKLAVQPDGYPLVKPPRYFGGDLLDQGSWKHYWGDVGTLADNLRQHVNA